MEQDRNPVRGRLGIDLAGIDPLRDGQTDGALRVFSGASLEAPRWATTATLAR